jgi:excisionase family DNA binding protein
VSDFRTVAAIAEEAGFSARTVLRWVEAGELEAVRFPGGRLRIPQSAWIAFLAEHATTNGARTLAGVDEGGE